MGKYCFLSVQSASYFSSASIFRTPLCASSSSSISMSSSSSSSPSSSSTIGSELNKLAHTAKSGWRPLVKYLYETRGIAYRDGVKEFIKEYKIGYREAIESERKNSSSENGGY
mmetsp:Transcript_9014/g.26178  ORF Transcript_9014/g.26178 Transcript_9014/m.26178 type:complete len:113 (-) Transcript_9014:2880-3218(-)